MLGLKMQELGFQAPLLQVLIGPLHARSLAETASLNEQSFLRGVDT